MQIRAGKVRSATVDMGKAVVEEDRNIFVGDHMVSGTPVSVGNPHFVIFVQDIESAPLDLLGPQIEKHEAFPGGVNVEFVQITGKDQLRMRVWERGSGITMACGTGACASAAAVVRKGFCHSNTPIRVELDGGFLEILVERDGSVKMTGPAEIVYEGETVI